MQASFNPSPYPRVIRMTELLAALGISKSSVHNFTNPESPHHVADFPTPIRLGHGKRAAMGWRSDEVHAWIESRPRTKD